MYLYNISIIPLCFLCIEKKPRKRTTTTVTMETEEIVQYVKPVVVAPPLQTVTAVVGHKEIDVCFYHHYYIFLYFIIFILSPHHRWVPPGLDE